MKSYTYFKIGKVTLTGRQSECLAGMMLGYTAKELADILKIRARTIHSYRQDIKQKFNGKSKSEIFISAFQSDFPIKNFIRLFKARGNRK